jgi:HrpA-like RNA helicase
MMAARAELPAWHAKSEVLDAVARSQVVVVCGATGCGKSTQIPQFLVDAFVEQQQQDKSPEAAIATTAAAETPAMASDGSATLSKLRPPRMVITQPRRVAALALAKRVADERCEQVCGDVIQSCGISGVLL